jgi:hypothetical protein
MKNLWVVFLTLLLAAGLGKPTALRAEEARGDSMAQGRDDSDLLVDHDVDTDHDIDETPTKFKDDSDDTYRDDSAQKDDTYDSKFKDVQDEETPDSDEWGSNQ